MKRYLLDFDLASLPKQVSDFLVIGSGVAGLFAAEQASRLGSVTLLTKDLLEGNTRYAQGGIAAAVDSADSWQEHARDTLLAGAGLCDPEAVRILVKEGPARIRDLIALGASFDLVNGEIALTREGGHRRRRVLHAGGDATGKEIEGALARAVLANPKVRLVNGGFAVDLLSEGLDCYGALALVDGALQAFLARATIVATGGAGQVFAHTTNSPLVTGDGIAMAYRAGAELMDLEFYQFHPTGLFIPGAPRALITEAVRGEGAYLLDGSGRRFLPDLHPLAELAPRDIVARAIVAVMEQTGSDHVWLDLRHLTAIDLPRRFPTVFASCQRYGLDIRRDLIPVSPVAHYFMGGIRVDYQGSTNLRGLLACGEAACLAVHGANRLASNSLLDGLVFGQRAAVSAAENQLSLTDRQLLQLPLASQPGRHPGSANELPEPRAGSERAEQAIADLQQLMWQGVGLTRHATGLGRAAEQLAALSALVSSHLSAASRWLEAANLVTLGQLITKAATLRTESRGGHYRADYPLPDDAVWRQHLVLRHARTDLIPVERG